RKNLLVMGPDCGTAIVRGVPLGFANVVRRGRIGLVGASGTGLQEVTCQIHRLGEGVSHAIGAGSHDVREDIGGITMRQGLDLLAADNDTAVIVIVSKPPAAAVQQKLLSQAAAIGKPVVVCFLGSAIADVKSPPTLHPVATLERAAAMAVSLARGDIEREDQGEDDLATSATAEARKFAPGQHYIRGLYSGGTFCAEAQIIWRQAKIAAYSNAPLDDARRLPDGANSREHSALDLGGDEFTVGRPHPMIDCRMRIERLCQEAADPAVAVIVLDIVLGYGSHEDPAGALAPAIREAKALAAAGRRHLSVVCFVCGTEEDPQRLTGQQETLRREGVLLVSSSTAAARLAAAIASRIGARSGGEHGHADARWRR
ncbi:MAG: hypothetical protein ACREEA_10760, partial [Stellaceae bacterium]